MLIPSKGMEKRDWIASLSRRVNANSQRMPRRKMHRYKLIKKGEC